MKIRVVYVLLVLIMAACNDKKEVNVDPFVGTYIKSHCNPSPGAYNSPETFKVTRIGGGRYTIEMNGLSVPVYYQPDSNLIKVVDYCQNQIIDLTMIVGIADVQLESVLAKTAMCPPLNGADKESYSCVYQKQ